MEPFVTIGGIDPGGARNGAKWSRPAQAGPATAPYGTVRATAPVTTPFPAAGQTAQYPASGPPTLPFAAQSDAARRAAAQPAPQGRFGRVCSEIGISRGTGRVIVATVSLSMVALAAAAGIAFAARSSSSPAGNTPSAQQCTSWDERRIGRAAADGVDVGPLAGCPATELPPGLAGRVSPSPATTTPVLPNDPPSSSAAPPAPEPETSSSSPPSQPVNPPATKTAPAAPPTTAPGLGDAYCDALAEQNAQILEATGDSRLTVPLPPQCG
jgi:hypothetical protein